MRNAVAPTLLAVLLAGSGPLRAAGPAGGVYALVQRPNGVVKASLFDPAEAALPIAKVGERTVLLSELTDAIGRWHQANVKKVSKATREKNFAEILDRLIGVQLIVQEAEAMGMDELDAAKDALQQYPEAALRTQLQRIAVKGVKADPAEAKRLYRDRVREWKLESVLFDKEDDAKALVAAAKGGNFTALAKKAVDEKKAKGGDMAAFFERGRMLQQVTVAVEKLKVGDVSAPIKVGNGFAVVKVVGERYPENPKVRAETQQQALESARTRAIGAFYKELLKRYVKIDEKILDSVDFEAKEPGFKALEKDQRVVATVAGGKPITVADLAAQANLAFFHGIDQAIESKKVNNKKATFLDECITRQVVALEAARLKVDRSPEYKKALVDYRNELLFSAFTSRVIAPEIKVTEADLKKYYEAHKAEFTYPAFYRLQSLAFFSHKGAQSAVDKLKAGTDFKWLQQNADDQVPIEQRAFDLQGGVVSGKALLPEVAKSIAGAKSGDVRLAEYGGQHFVIVVSQVTPPTAQPFEEVKATIVPNVQAEATQKALGDWIAKLRKAHDVKVYITKIVS